MVDNVESMMNPASGASIGGIDLQSLAQLVAQINSIQAATTKASLNPLMDPMSPYYVHPGENPGITLISKVLDNRNYHSWAQSMLCALKSKNKVASVDGFLPKPDKDDPNFSAWDRCNMFVVSWIRQSLTPEIAQSVLWIEIALDLWNDVKKRFYQGNVFRVAELEEELFAIRQGEVSITTYFTKLKTN